MSMNNLTENPNLFKRGGVINRKDYVRNMLILFAASFAIFMFAGNGIVNNDLVLTGIFAIAMVLLVGISYLTYINSFKRMRDIRGTNRNEIPWIVGLVILMSMPYVTLVPLAILLFAEGAITGNSTVFARFEEQWRGRKELNNVVRLDERRKNAIREKDQKIA